jgi:hypothetical protein
VPACSEINQLPIGEALADEFDGKTLNPHGVEIDLPFWVFKSLPIGPRLKWSK